MRFSTAGGTLWDASYPSLVAEKHGLWDATTSRGEAQTLRLAMLYALLDGTETIDVPHVRAALAVWRYCDDSARIIFHGGGDETLEVRIKKAIAQRPGLTRTELRNLVDHKLKASDLTRSLDWLVDRGEIERQRDGRTERYYPATNTPTGMGSPTERNVKINATNCHSNNAETDTPTGDTGDAPTMTADEFVAELAPDTDFTDKLAGNGKRATLTELVNWKNANGGRFVKRPDGLIWVIPEPVDSSLVSALHAHQDTLRSFVGEKPTLTAQERIDRGDWRDDDELRELEHQALVDEIEAFESLNAT
jgi:hypothetical protein